MFARRHSNKLSSTLEQKLIILQRADASCTSRENWVRTTTSFKLTIEIFSIPKTLISDNFDKLAFSLNKTFIDDVIFSHADMLPGCPLYANNIIKFRAYRRLICCYPTRMSRKTWAGREWTFRRRWRFFIACTTHACGRVHSIFSCRPGFGLHSHLLLHAAIRWKGQAKRRHVSHRSMGACGAFLSLRVHVSKCMRTSRWCVSCGNMKSIRDIFYQVPHASPRGLLL